MKNFSFKLLVIALSTSTSAFAWGPEGHQIVAQIAAQHLTPAAAKNIADLLGNSSGEALADISSLPDQWRNQDRATGAWHFVDIPLGSSYSSPRDCRNDQCVVAKISEFATNLGNANLSKQQRAIALAYVVHFVGDVHQPLHCANNHDEGGNGVKVMFSLHETNLHKLWDGELLKLGDGKNAASTAYRLNSMIGHDSIVAWSQGSPASWADESHMIAETVAYGQNITTTHVVTQAYAAQAEPTINMQLEKAGIRLAALLNAVLRY